MKQLFSVIIIVLFSFPSVQGQSKEESKSKYRVWVSTINDPFLYQGSLYALQDSSILIKSVVIIDSLDKQTKTIELRIGEIELVEVRRKNRVGIAGIIGAFTGLAVGGVLGFASGDDTNGGLTASEKAVLGGVTLAIPGALVGVLVGSSKIVVPINRSNPKYLRAKPQLSTYSILK